MLGEAGLSAFAPALREEGVTLQGLCESSLEEIEEVIEHPLRGKARTAFAKLLGVSAAPPAPPKTPSRKAPAPASTGASGAPVPFVEGLEDCIECDACGAPGREFEVCGTCGKIVTQRRLRPTPRLKRQESIEAGQPPDKRPSGTHPVKELSGLPILSNAFGTLQTEEEVESVA